MSSRRSPQRAGSIESDSSKLRRRVQDGRQCGEPKTRLEGHKNLNKIQDIINRAPGCYANDDGSDDIRERYNFYVHGRRFLFAPCALGIFTESNQFRQLMVRIVTSKEFDNFILLLIVLNSVILALADYSIVDSDGNLDPTRSIYNAIVLNADHIFTTLFAIECSMKIIAMGLFGEQGAYLMDPWNWLDFVVVFIGILAVIPNIQSVSVLRTFRVLRPLRSLNAIAGMKKLVSALLQSIPELLTVVAFLSFLFFLYGVIGIQLWSGMLSGRCRMTPFPLQLNPNITYSEFDAYKSKALANVSSYRCLDDNGLPLELFDDSWELWTSPWKEARVCFWPIAHELKPQTCDLDGGNYRQCPVGQTCGSDYDTFGNFRFTHPDPLIERNILRSAVFNSAMGYGLVSFDNIALASLTIFQCITRDGWSDIMYMLQDAGYDFVAVGYFVSFIILGSYFMLNLTLAVIWENFSEVSSIEAEEKEVNLRRNLGQLTRDRKKSLIPFLPTSPIRIFVGKVVTHRVFHGISYTLVLLNTIILSLDKYPVDDLLNERIEAINFCLACLFLTELILKLFGLGWHAWKADVYNAIDAVVVLVAAIEAALSPPPFLHFGDVTYTSTVNFSGLRSLRIFALFKVARFWPSLGKLLSTMYSTIKEIGNFSVLLLLFMYIYALIGMQTFAFQFRFDKHGYSVGREEEAYHTPRSTFDGILWSMVTVFQILTGQNWTTVMLDGYRASNWSAILYFVSLVVLGDFIVLNLFLAILLGNFEESSEDEATGVERQELRRRARIAPSMTNFSIIEDRTDTNIVCERGSFDRSASKLTLISNRGRREAKGILFRQNSTNSAFLQQRAKADAMTSKITKRSLFIFSMENPIRVKVIHLITHPQFDNITLLLIGVSTLAVALDNPLDDPDGLLAITLQYLDIVLTSLFILEAVIKIIGLGFIMDKHTYLRDEWNVMDFVITVLATLSFQNGNQFKFIKTIRTFRALRPLRMISRNPGLKLVVSSLLASIPQILNVLFVCLLIFTIFSIIAVNNFKGSFDACQGDAFDTFSNAQQNLIANPRIWANLTSVEQSWFNDTIATVYKNYEDSSQVTSKLVCGWMGATWMKSQPQHFDNVISGLQAFFEMSTTESWVNIMLAGVDAAGMDMQPKLNNRPLWSLFFITFVLIGAFFLMQLFVGVVIDNFNRLKQKLDGTSKLSTSQREWLLVNESMLNLRPVRRLRIPRDPLRRYFFKWARDPNLELIIMSCIILNTVVMSAHYFGEEDLYRSALDYTNYVFAGIFTMEAIVKIIGLGRYYWKDAWNIFDFVIVIGTLLGIVYTWYGGKSVGTVATVVRSFRVGRLFRLVQSAPSLRQLFNTLLVTLPSLANIGALLSLVFFIYAVMGVQLFAKVKFGNLITSTSNFRTIWRALLTLIRCATGEKWNLVMYELSNEHGCNPDPDYNTTYCGFSNHEGCIPLNGCGATNGAYIYFYSFTLIFSFIMLNIFIAVILEGFAIEKDKSEGILLPSHYDNFTTVWSKFDQEATGFMEWHFLPNFIMDLAPPMGYGGIHRPPTKEVAIIIEHLDIPIYRGNKVFLNDVARRIGKLVVEELCDEPLGKLPSALKIEQRWLKYLATRKIRRNDLSVYRVNQFNAALLLHGAVKGQFFREDLQEKIEAFKNHEKNVVQLPKRKQAVVMRSDSISEDISFSSSDDSLSLSRLLES